LLLLGGCTAASEAQSVAKPLPVTASGRIDSASEARFLVAERDGVISTVHVRAGDQVAAGSALMSLSCTAEQALATAAAADANAARAEQSLIDAGVRDEQRAASAARLEQADALARDADASLARAEQLGRSGFLAAGRLDTLRAQAAAAAAAAAAARADWTALANGPRPDERRAAAARAEKANARADAARADVERCTLRAPIAGTVARVLRRSGEFSGASTGTPVVVLADLSNLMVRAEIADRDAPRVALGDRALVSIDGQPGRWPAHVIELASQMGRRSARSLDPTDRFDRDVREALLQFEGPLPPAVIGLRVNVEFPG
jgi:multidrug resistance efflux pump